MTILRNGFAVTHEAPTDREVTDEGIYNRWRLKKAGEPIRTVVERSERRVPPFGGAARVFVCDACWGQCGHVETIRAIQATPPDGDGGGMRAVA